MADTQDSPDAKPNPPLKNPEAGKRRFLSSDWKFIAEHVTTQLQERKNLMARSDHSVLWKEVDRQVAMKPMSRTSRNNDQFRNEEWRSALELGDLSTAFEVLSADVLRLIFPTDRSWIQPHTEIDFDRLNLRATARGGQGLSKRKQRKIQKQADAEIKAFMSQQHKDFGLRARVELSVKEALKHGSFVAEVNWKEIEQFKMGGVFTSKAAPVWTPHSMWNCYPETHELGTDLLYQGSMIISWEKSYEWVLRQPYINLKGFEDRTSDKKSKVELISYFGDITVVRKGKNVFLPNMKIIVANDTVLFAQPMDHLSIIYAGYDRVDVRDPYYMSPLVKHSPNHKLSTIIANRFVDATELKIEPPGTYDGNDPQLVLQGGPIIEPGYMSATRGGDQAFKLFDIGDPSWALQAITYFQQQTEKGTGVSGSRAGAERQADRVTATQIEEESAGSQIRTIDFTGKVEKGLESYLYISHELNKTNLSKYKYYNPEMGMADFDTMTKKDLPKNIIFDIVGSKSILMERRRAEGTFQVTQFLLSNEATAPLVNAQEVALQMYMDAGNKTPERLLNIGDENDRIKQAVEQVQEKAQEVIEDMQGQVQETGRDLLKSEQLNDSLKEQQKIEKQKNDKTEQGLREDIQALKADKARNAEFLQELGKIKDEKDALEKIGAELDQRDSGPEQSSETTEPSDSKEGKRESVVVKFPNPNEFQGYEIIRDDNKDAKFLVPIEEGKDSKDETEVKALNEAVQD